MAKQLQCSSKMKNNSSKVEVMNIISHNYLPDCHDFMFILTSDLFSSLRTLHHPLELCWVENLSTQHQRSIQQTRITLNMGAFLNTSRGDFQNEESLDNVLLLLVIVLNQSQPTHHAHRIGKILAMAKHSPTPGRRPGRGEEEGRMKLMVVCWHLSQQLMH